MNIHKETSILMMLRGVRRKARALLHDRSANVAMMFGLSIVPIMLATGAGLDFARGMQVHQRMGEALDAAALAVGNAATKPSKCPGTTQADKTACANLTTTAQQYFDVNYDHTKDANYGSPQPVTLNIANQAVTVTSNLALNLTLLGISVLNVGKPNVTASSTVVWGQTRMWVALVLDNSGSMDKGDSSGTKMEALKDALTNSSYGVLKTFQSASATAGDIQVGIVPFTRSVNMGYSAFANSKYIDWGEWEAPPAVPGTDLKYDIDNPYDSSPATISFEAWGPGDECPFTTSSSGWNGTTISRKSPFGFTCTSGPANSAGTVADIPDSGSYKGYICPGLDSGDYNSDHRDRYYNGCWTSTKSNNSNVRVSKGYNASCGGFSSSNCTCNGNGNGRHCDTQKWTHVWVPNAHSTWTGCVMDRQQKNKQTTLGSGNGLRTAAGKDYDESNTQPTGNSSAWDDSQFPAENPSSCPDAAITAMGYDWTSLSSKVSNMDPNGSTNQAIGVAHGFQMLTTGAPYATGTAPSGTSRVMILFSDGLNTQDRWYGDGSTEGTTQDGYIDDRMKATCTAAKDAGIIIYAIFVHIGSNGSSSALKNCATDTSKYYDLTSSSAIKTAFQDISQKVTNLRISQ
jgi:Flp pilus assembly protein TadG